MAEPYDPYIPASSKSDNNEKNDSGHQKDGQTTRVQREVDDVVNIMQDNVDKVMNRGERIDTLRGKAEDLNATAGNFKRGANQVRRRMWWKDLKWKIIIGVTIIIILGVIIGSIVGTQTHKNDQAAAAATTDTKPPE